MFAQPITVAFRYTVHQTCALFALDNPVLANIIQGNERHLFCVVEANLYRRHPSLLNALARYCEVHDLALAADRSLLIEKETVSGLVARIREGLGSAALPPSSYVLALGDSALIDAVGLAVAATATDLRMIRAPTTALGQCETAVGISSNIDVFDETLKARILVPPYAVINDTAFLATQASEWPIACAQALKMALAHDRAFFDFIETHSARLVDRDLSVMEALVHRCAGLRLRSDARADAGAFVAPDLDAWLSESAEPLAGRRLGPADAIPLGIGLGATYAQLAGLLSRAEWDRLLALVAALGLNAWPTHVLDSFDLWRALAGRLARRDAAAVMLPCNIGRVTMVPHLDADMLAHSITLLQHRARVTAVSLPEAAATKATKYLTERIATPGFREVDPSAHRP